MLGAGLTQPLGGSTKPSLLYCPLEEPGPSGSAMGECGGLCNPVLTGAVVGGQVAGWNQPEETIHEKCWGSVVAQCGTFRGLGEAWPETPFLAHTIVGGRVSGLPSVGDWVGGCRTNKRLDPGSEHGANAVRDVGGAVGLGERCGGCRSPGFPPGCVCCYGYTGT